MRGLQGKDGLKGIPGLPGVRGEPGTRGLKGERGMLLMHFLRNPSYGATSVAYDVFEILKKKCEKK